MKDSVKRTNTTLFLLPLLKEVEEGFNNSYIHDDKIAITYGSDTKYITINKSIETVLPHFKEGKYSEFPNNLKQQILSFWGITSEKERIYQILYPETYYLELGMTTPSIKEIWPKPNMSDEIYKYQNHESSNNQFNKSSVKSDES